ncbi:hypothetical protein BJ741DRAFT_687398 [Chytriomyces cf. hyalinus JEL632]|nr:hypothetical protein BJ741DRAFT_687398 [Chytriomyces cf. hyalinus JEL632]
MSAKAPHVVRKSLQRLRPTAPSPAAGSQSAYTDNGKDAQNKRPRSSAPTPTSNNSNNIRMQNNSLTFSQQQQQQHEPIDLDASESDDVVQFFNAASAMDSSNDGASSTAAIENTDFTRVDTDCDDGQDGGGVIHHHEIEDDDLQMYFSNNGDEDGTTAYAFNQGNQEASDETAGMHDDLDMTEFYSMDALQQSQVESDEIRENHGGNDDNDNNEPRSQQIMGSGNFAAEYDDDEDVEVKSEDGDRTRGENDQENQFSDKNFDFDDDPLSPAGSVEGDRYSGFDANDASGDFTFVASNNHEDGNEDETTLHGGADHIENIKNSSKLTSGSEPKNLEDPANRANSMLLIEGHNLYFKSFDGSKELTEEYMVEQRSRLSAVDVALKMREFGDRIAEKLVQIGQELQTFKEYAREKSIQIEQAKNDARNKYQEALSNRSAAQSRAQSLIFAKNGGASNEEGEK